jgi:hypothetical protein
MSYGCGATMAPTRASQLPQEGPWRRSERECRPLTLYATGDRTTATTTCQDGADGVLSTLRCPADRPDAGE